MPDYIEDFDTLSRIVLEQGHKLRDLEAHVEELECRLRLRAPHLALVIDKPISLELVEAQS